MSSQFSPRPAYWLAAIALCSLFAQRAHAQRVAVDSLTLAPDQSGFIAFPGAWTPGHLCVDGTIWTSYAKRPMGGDLGPFIEHRFETTLSLQLGLGTRVALAVRMPFLVHQNDARVQLVTSDTETVFDPEYGTVAIPSTYAIEKRAMGNPALDGRFHLLGLLPPEFDATSWQGALALRALIHVPLADPAHAYYADEQLRTELGAVVEVARDGYSFATYAAWRHRTGYTPLADNELKNTATVSFGFKAPLRLIRRASPLFVEEHLSLELRTGSAPGSDGADFYPFEALASYRLQLETLTFSIGGGGALKGAIGFSDARALAAMTVSL